MNGGVPSRESKNLAHPDYEALLRRFDPDAKRGIEKYENLRRRLVKFFEWNRCFADSADLADQTMDTVAKKPDDLEIRNVDAYAYRVARNTLSEFRRRSRREVYFDESIETRASESEPDPEKALVTTIDNRKRVDWLKTCLSKLKGGDRTLVLDYYSSQTATNMLHRQNLAQKIGISIETLRVKVNRIRETLERCLKDSRGETNEAARIAGAQTLMKPSE
jgi:RNA polymerase sigma factor (sigma-70 family)